MVSELVFLQRPTERFYQGQQFTTTYEKSILADLGIYMGARDSAYIANDIIMSDRERWIATVQKIFRVCATRIPLSSALLTPLCNQ